MRQINPIERGSIALFLLIVFLCTTCSAFSEINSSGKTADSDLGFIIERKTNDWRTSSKRLIGGEQIYSSVLVERFYKGRNYQPAWIHNGPARVATLIKALENVYTDGLTAANYHFSVIQSLAGKTHKELTFDQIADLDILLTDAYLTLSCHLSGGCVDPVKTKTEWFAQQRTMDVSSLLEQALKTNRISESLTSLLPRQGSYERLKQALGRYRELLLKGQWPSVTCDRVLKKGFSSDRVAELRKRLAASGDLVTGGTGGGNLFDGRLEQSVRLFQMRHGLKADGIVGPDTLSAINVPLKQRIRQIELNMERMRWMSDNAEPRSIVVNITDFRLSVMENEKKVLSMKVVVGKPILRTPVFTAKMTYLVINPSWNVPQNIAREEILTKIKHDPQYIAKQNIKVLRGRGSQAKETDPEAIDWAEINADSLVYRFRQEPGRSNPLGHIKFMLPNRFDVYLHDTPSKGLFSRSVRTFSHGCIRIEKPFELAEYLLQDDPLWNREKLLTAIDKGKEQTILLPNPLNVHFVYLTAWVDEEGVLQFRNDIYKKDEQLDSALSKAPSFK